MLDSLHHLLLIVEHGTFTEAARRAHLSQPALTASIRRLEDFFGATLLHRGRRGAAPTAAGEALLPRARAALAAIDEGRRAIEEVLELRTGEVRMGAGATACTYLLPKEIARYRRAHPGVTFRLRETTTEEAKQAVLEGDLDLAVTSSPSGAAHDDPTWAMLDDELWRVDELILVAAPDLALEGASYLTFRPGSTTRELFQAVFPEADVVMELGSIAAVKGHVRAGVGIALVSEDAVRDDLRRRKMVRVPDPRTPVERELRLVHRGRERLAPAVAALRELLLEPRPSKKRAPRKKKRRTP